MFSMSMNEAYPKYSIFNSVWTNNLICVWLLRMWWTQTKYKLGNLRETSLYLYEFDCQIRKT